MRTCFQKRFEWMLLYNNILQVANLESWAKPNKTPKNLLFIFPLPFFLPVQCCRLMVVGALVENSASRCLSHSLINIEWRDRGDCRSVTLILSTIVDYHYQNINEIYMIDANFARSTRRVFLFPHFCFRLNSLIEERFLRSSELDIQSLGPR